MGLSSVKLTVFGFFLNLLVIIDNFSIYFLGFLFSVSKNKQIFFFSIHYYFNNKMSE